MNKLSKGIAITMSASMVFANGAVFENTVNAAGETNHNYTGNQSKLTFDGGKHRVVLNDVNINENGSNSAIDIKGNADVTIVLNGSNSLEGAGNHPAIWVESGSSLTIEGTGSLEARAGGTTPGFGAAGIGSGYGTNTNFGDITIKSGTVVAWGSEGGAGIGGGYEVGRGTATGNITIEGGYVKAYSERNGAGIGAGQNASYAGTVTISGGLVYASGVVSIGGGSRVIGGTNSGAFSTGTDGNAVIVAPDGIGSNAGYKDWDGIFLGYNADENSAKLVGDTVVFDDSDANIQVWGTPKMDKNITVNQGTTLKVIQENFSGASSTLTMPEDKILNNNGEIVVGITGGIGTDTSKLVLEGGKEKTAGNGELSVDGGGTVVVPVTDSIVSLLNADNLVYDGKEKKPTVKVKLELWGKEKTYKNGTDYDVAYANNTNAGDNAGVTVSAKDRGALLSGSSCSKTFSIAKAKFDPGIPNVWSVQEGETELLKKLPKPVKDTNPEGTLSWHPTEDRTTPLTDTFVQSNKAGDEVIVYGRYVHTDPNYYYPADGELLLKIVKYAVPEMDVKLDGQKVTEINKTYGDASVTLTAIAYKDKNKTIQINKPDISYSSSNGKVAQVNSKTGEVTFVGAGKAIITVTLAGDDDEQYSTINEYVAINVSPKEVNVKQNNITIPERAYNGKTEIDATGIQAELEDGSIINNDDVNLKVTSARMDDANVGQDKKVHIEYALVGNKASNYTLANEPDGKVTITKVTGVDPGTDPIPAEMSGNQTIYNKEARQYGFNLNAIVPTQKIGGVTKITVLNSTVNKAYFTKNELDISKNSQVIHIPVKKVDTDLEGYIGEIKLKIEGNNFDTTGVIKLTAKNPSQGGGTGGGSTGGGTNTGGTSSEKDIIGEDRYETAGLIADRIDYYDSVILVNANEALADGLSAAALSGKEDAPILLVKKDSIPKATMDRIKNVSKVYIIGGEDAVSKKVEEQLKGKTIERIGGKDRIETSMLISKKLGNYNKVFLVNGYTGEADAMSASAAAAKYEAPIILTNGKKSELAKKSNVDYYAIGGDAVLEDSLVDKYDAERLGGKDRYETNRLVIKELYKNSSKYYYTKGNPLVDALTISLRAKDNGVVLVSPKSDNSILKGKDLVQVGGMDFKIEPIK